MALKEYVGAVVLEIDGREFEVVSLDVTHNTGKKPVITMNRTGKAAGFCQGVKTWTISASTAIPKEGEGDVDWSTIEGAKITVFPVSEGGRRISYTDCFAQEVGEKYEAENEARRDLTLIALNMIEE